MKQESPVRILSYILPRTKDLLFILLYFMVLANGFRMLNSDGDLPRHLLMGKYVLEVGRPPTSEVFAYPYAGREYIPHEWGAGVIFYLAYLAFELNGVVVLSGILICTTFLLIFQKASKNNGEPLLTFVLTLWGAVVTSTHWVTRPHLFTMLFLASWLILVDDQYRNAQRKLWIFPVLMLFWANIHAEYITGFLILGAYLADSIWSFWISRSKDAFLKIRKILTILFLSFFASLINPSGVKAWATVIGYISNSYLMSVIDETKPPNFALPAFLPLLILYLFSVMLLVRQRKKFTLADFFLVGGFGLMSATSSRNVHLFGVVAPFVLARGLQGIWVSQALKNVERMIARLESFGRGKAIPVVSTILLSILLLIGPLKNYNRFNPEFLPTQAVQWLENNPQSGRMFNEFGWGGYILLRLWPEQQVFIESQTDTQGDLTRLYLAVVSLDSGWEDIFKTYNIEWAIIRPEWQLAKELQEKKWAILYQDDTTIILRRP